MKRLISVFAIASLTISVTIAQQLGIIQLGSPAGTFNMMGEPDPSGPVRVEVDNPGTASARYRVFAPLGTDVVIPLHFYIYGIGHTDWNAFAIDLLYDFPKGDVGMLHRNGYRVWHGEHQGTYTRLQWAAVAADGITGLAAGQVVSAPFAPVTNIQVAIAAGGTTRNRFSDNAIWAPNIPYNVLLTENIPLGRKEPYVLKLKNVQAGDTFSFRLGRNGISFISQGTRNFNTQAWLGTWEVVPEPASMIALGSGLVGLLALRRRRSN